MLPKSCGPDALHPAWADDGGAVERWLGKFFTPAASRPTGQLLMTLNEAIAESFSYKRRTSRGTQTPLETIERQEGTCRDFAFLMMEAARSLGFAAKFVTGYLYVPTRDSAVRIGGGSNSCLVPDLCAGLGLGRVGLDKWHRRQSRFDPRCRRAHAGAGDTLVWLLLG